MYVDIDLTDPNLGARLLEDPKGDLPIDVCDAYFREHSDGWRPVVEWCVDPSDPELDSIRPQHAVDMAEPLVAEVIRHLLSDSPSEALAAARRASGILVSGSSDYQPKKGQPATMRPIAVRAYIIRKFNPDPTRPRESAVKWHELADMLFLENGKCPRKIREERETRICGVTNHRYDSACVEALMTAVTHLKAAMKRDGIPV